MVRRGVGRLYRERRPLSLSGDVRGGLPWLPDHWTTIAYRGPCCVRVIEKPIPEIVHRERVSGATQNGRPETLSKGALAMVTRRMTNSTTKGIKHETHHYEITSRNRGIRGSWPRGMRQHHRQRR